MIGTVHDISDATTPDNRAEHPDRSATPIVTVVMANYNGARTIETALRSALAQSLRNIEVIVTDDASTDDSADRVAFVALGDARVRLLRANTNGGPAAARNLCLAAARGRWIAVMDSDDLMHPERLEQLVAAAEHDGADIAADDLLIFDDNPAITPTTCLRGDAATSAFWVDAADYVRANTLFSGGQSLGYLKPLIRANAIEDRGLRYDTTLRIAEDYDFILRLLVCGARFRVYPRLLYFYRKHSGSISHRLSRRTLEPMLAAHDRASEIAGNWDGRLIAAMTMRRASLQRALEFDDLVSALKRRDWRDALVQAFRSPRVAALLRGPIIDRLHRLRVGRSSEAAAARRQVCVLSRQRIIGNTNGSSVYLLSICTALRQSGCDVHLLSPSPAVFGRWPVLWLRPEMGVFRSIRLRGSVRVGPLFIATAPATVARAAIGMLGKLISRLGMAPGWLDRPAPYAVSQAWTRQDVLFVARHARPHADIVIADYAFLTDGIPYTLCPGARSLVVMHDLFSSRSAQFNRLGTADSVASIEQPAEMALLGKADAIVAIQADEAATVRRCLPGHAVIIAPIAVTPVDEPQPGRDRSILFVGSNTAPNILGLRWFLEAIWPIVRSKVPDATLRVAGSVCGTVRPLADGVRLLGSVRDLAALYRQAAVVISPLQVGSGLKIKLIEALGQGKAIVATGVTLQGVEENVRRAVTVADDPADFAAAVISLLGNEALRMARATAALDLARRQFASAACHAELLTFVSSASFHGRETRQRR
jgi:succinoglycan biosynthesis protein ExoO